MGLVVRIDSFLEQIVHARQFNQGVLPVAGLADASHALGHLDRFLWIGLMHADPRGPELPACASSPSVRFMQSSHASIAWPGWSSCRQQTPRLYSTPPGSVSGTRFFA